ncbi:MULTISPECIES: TetR/AcrR family transcriptional regulator [Phenylobacterium]|jgi:AcrR family transcriptional regulator|uniref:TetR/AcrR family transcriptional regulator n=1 Tax=Phenylobacterium conjunctum TaxID=1298959 RepID=A0ABW3T732_9CAUL
MTLREAKSRGAAAETLKRVARRLFAERGVDGVTVRQIAEAAGQKNHAAVGYYFGSKEALIRELVVDGARLIDEARNAWLDRLEAQGGPRAVAEVVDALVYPSLAAQDRENDYNRFIVMLSTTHRDLFMDALGGRWNSGYLRCLDHLRRLTPGLTATLQSQRFVFLGASLGSVLAMREAELADASREHPTWGSAQTLAHFAQGLTAMLTAPAPPEPALDPAAAG